MFRYTELVDALINVKLIGKEHWLKAMFWMIKNVKNESIILM